MDEKDTMDVFQSLKAVLEAREAFFKMKSREQQRYSLYYGCTLIGKCLTIKSCLALMKHYVNDVEKSESAYFFRLEKE